MRILDKGAEATISESDGKIIKDRTKKVYRIPELDKTLRESRTKAEAALLRAAKRSNIPVPLVLKEEETALEIEKINGYKLKAFLENTILEAGNNNEPGSANALYNIGINVGKIIAKLHEANIIHGDLTTSNILIQAADIGKNSAANESVIELNTTNSKIFLIDFGLGLNSRKIEDKATDLSVLKRSIKAMGTTTNGVPVDNTTMSEARGKPTSLKSFDNLWKHIEEGYANKEVLEKLEEIEKRGRYIKER